MSKQGTDQDRMYSWLKLLPSNQQILASPIYVNAVNKKDSKKIKKKKQSPKRERKKSKAQLKKHRMLRLEAYYNKENEERDGREKNEEPQDQQYGASHKQKQDDSIRVWFTNPCGIGIDPKSLKSHGSFRFVKSKSKADIIGLAETNVNWSLLKNSCSLYSRVKENWRNFRTVTSHNVTEQMGKCQRGGTCMYVVGQTAYRVHSTGKDRRGLGRWSWIQVQGKDKHYTRVYTAYRTGQKPTSSKLTTTYDQQMRYIRKKKMNTQPRTLFDSDIIKEFKKIIKDGIQIVLMIDANEDIGNGKFTSMLREISLKNVFETLQILPMPPTHHSGSRPISTIYASTSLQVKSAGILQKGIGIQGDHRNIFVDFTQTSFIGAPLFKVESPPIKKLQLQDSRIYNRFLKHLIKHIHSTNLHEKAKSLIQTCTSTQVKDVDRKMETIDEQLGRGISSGIKNCRKKRMGQIPFSGMLRDLWKERRLWLLVYKRRVGQKISNRTIRRLAKARDITNPLSYHILDIKERLKNAELRYRQFVPHAKTEREKFFEELAIANATEGNTSKEKLLKRIMNTESAREQGRIMRRFFPKNTIMKQVDRVKFQTNGIEYEVHQPNDIIDAIQKETKRKYSSTSETPLMRPDVHELLGNYAETPFARGMQNGNVPYPTDFSRWTKSMLDKVKIDHNIPQQLPIMTKEEVRSVWQATKEQKASSLSGRYNAVYKCMSKHPFLLELLTNTMNIPFVSGRPYDRWHKFLDIMSFKKRNNIQVDALRTIIISEADWNASGKIFVTRRMMRQAEALHLLPKEHIGGRKGKKATDGALTKRLIMENAIALKRPMAIISTDAANCYDRMIHKFIALSCRKWGVPIQVIKPLLQPLQRARHFTRTAFGDSNTYFEGTNLQGAGQGNTGAAPFWTSVSTHMIEIMKDHLYHAKFTSPLTKKEIILSLIAFVDDTELFLTSENDDIQELIDKATQAINVWRETLHVTGGVMRPEKCAWTLMAYSPKGKSTKLLQEADTPGELYIPNQDGDLEKISRYEGTDAREYLGVKQTTTGNDKAQIRKLEEKIDAWNLNMSKSTMFPIYNLQATSSRINRTIAYPLPTMTMTPQSALTLSNRLYSKVLPKCGITSKFPITHRYLSQRFQGLNLPNLYSTQEISKIKELLNFGYTNTTCWDQMKLGLEHLQLRLGSQDIIYSLPFSRLEHLIPNSWFKTQWKFINHQNLKIKGWTAQIPPLRENDQHLMIKFVEKGVPKEDLQTLNKCRYYLQVNTLAEVSTGDGLRIKLSILDGHRPIDRISPYKWQTTQKPTVRDWKVWSQYLKSTFSMNPDSRILRHPMGKWEAHILEASRWFYHKDANRIFQRIPNSTLFKKYEYTLDIRTSPRSRIVWYKSRSILRLPMEIVNQMEIATVNELRDCNYVAFEGSDNSVRTPPTPVNPNLNQQLQQNGSPKWMQRYLPDSIKSLRKTELQHFMQQKLVMVSDGSYDENVSSAAIIIETEDMQKRLVFPIMCPANDDDLPINDSYRAEMIGVLAGLTFIKTIEELTGQNTHVQISCDNDSVLDVAENYTYASGHTRHFDAVKSMISIRRQIHSTLSYLQVDGHADKTRDYESLTRVEQLNVECDLIAKSVRQLPPLHSSENYLQGEGLTVWWKNHKIYSKLDQHLHAIFQDSHALQIIRKKYHLTPTQFHDIDWNATQKASSFMSAQKNIWVSKFVTRTLPVGKNMTRRNHWSEDYCPRCKLCVETHDHLLTCNHSQCHQIFHHSLDKLDIWLEEQQTPPKLHEQLLILLTSWKHGEVISQNYNYVKPIQDQIQLGWVHLMEGRLVQSFTTYMSQHYDAINSKRKGSTWTSLFICKMWTWIYGDIWQNRNEFVHKKNEEAIATRTRENLQSEMRLLYFSEQQHNLLHQDQHLYTQPLSKLLQNHDAFIKAWNESMRIAIFDRDRVFLPEDRAQSAFMRSWVYSFRIDSISSPSTRTTTSTTKRKKRVNTKPRRQPHLTSQHTITASTKHPLTSTTSVPTKRRRIQ